MSGGPGKSNHRNQVVLHVSRDTRRKRKPLKTLLLVNYRELLAVVSVLREGNHENPEPSKGSAILGNFQKL